MLNCWGIDHIVFCQGCQVEGKQLLPAKAWWQNRRPSSPQNEADTTFPRCQRRYVGKGLWVGMIQAIGLQIPSPVYRKELLCIIVWQQSRCPLLPQINHNDEYVTSTSSKIPNCCGGKISQCFLERENLELLSAVWLQIPSHLYSQTWLQCQTKAYLNLLSCSGCWVSVCCWVERKQLLQDVVWRHIWCPFSPHIIYNAADMHFQSY